MPNVPKPVLAGQPIQCQTPVNPIKPNEENWCFSFRFWRQINFFGLDRSDPNWFVSLLERLQTLSEENVERFFLNPSKSDWYRFHSINWNQKNMPIKRRDFNWLHPDYLKNEDEYPFVQFQISKGLGRIVGFFDERRIFNILLLDPLHNIQPSKDYGYRVDPCSPLPCQHSLLLDKVNQLASLKATLECGCDCTLCVEIDNIQSDYIPINIVMFSVDDVDIEDAQELKKSGKYTSYAEIFQAGIYYSS